MSIENSWRFSPEERRRRQAAHILPKQRSSGKVVAGYVDEVLKTKLRWWEFVVRVGLRLPPMWATRRTNGSSSPMFHLERARELLRREVHEFMCTV